VETFFGGRSHISSKSVVTICYGFALRSIRPQRNAESTRWSNPLLGAESSLLFYVSGGMWSRELRTYTLHNEFLLASRKKLIDNLSNAVPVGYHPL